MKKEVLITENIKAVSCLSSSYPGVPHTGRADFLRSFFLSLLPTGILILYSLTELSTFSIRQRMFRSLPLIQGNPAGMG